MFGEVREGESVEDLVGESRDDGWLGQIFDSSLEVVELVSLTNYQ